MLHLLYLLAFFSLAALAIGNLIRNIMVLGTESQRSEAAISPRQNAGTRRQANLSRSASGGMSQAQQMNLHPEMLDENGRPIREPLLVMKSMTVDDARDRLDALFQASPENPNQDSD
ncbi:MAG: DUF2973 domain-containing protein [Cyanobacteria bacterium P01_D01_bin.73]